MLEASATACEEVLPAGDPLELRRRSATEVLAPTRSCLSSATKEVLPCTGWTAAGWNGKPAPSTRSCSPATSAPNADRLTDQHPDSDDPRKESLIEYPSRFPDQGDGREGRRLRPRDHARSPSSSTRPSTPRTVELRDSKAGNYLGVTITVTATSREQLDELYRTLSSHPMVKVVL